MYLLGFPNIKYPLIIKIDGDDHRIYYLGGGGGGVLVEEISKIVVKYIKIPLMYTYVTIQHL